MLRSPFRIVRLLASAYQAIAVENLALRLSATQIHQKYRSTTRGGPELPSITLVAITT
jgi:hypothetical protein